MKSKLRMEMDWDSNRPCIRLEAPVQSSDDVRDDLFKIFLGKIESGFFFVTPQYSYYKNDSGEQMYSIRIYSVSPEEMEKIYTGYKNNPEPDFPLIIRGLLKPEWVKQEEDEHLLNESKKNQKTT